MSQDTEQLPFREIPPPRRDAIHRALLTGLLASIASKGEKHEYTGPRGAKLSIHPGSGLFKNQPQWLMAAELVETTRLYARTCARIHPLWIERAGEHLLKRSYSDPHWNDHNHHVNAFERVTLFGLTIVPRRGVNFGPIDPKTSRQIFILNALVEGRFKTAAPFFKRNHELIEQARQIEARLRRRDLLVEPQRLYAFYDARLPADVFDGPSFEKWFRASEQHHRHQLLMSLRDVVVPDAPPLDAQLYPDFLAVSGSRLRLSYIFDPSSPTDGVTATVPLALLNQLDAQVFDWLIPGWLADKIAALIRSLPRGVRTKLVPVPDFVTRVMESIRFGQGGFFATIADRLGNLAGEVIPVSSFNLNDLPPHLSMNIAVVDESGRVLAASRDIRSLREQLADVTRDAFKHLPRTPFHKDNLTRWDFGDLPASVTIRQPGITVLGYPALVEEKQQVHLRLLDSPDAADRAMRAGMRRLFMRQLDQEFKYISRNIRGWTQLALHHATLGPAEQLRNSLLVAIADDALFGRAAATVRAQHDFARRAADAYAHLADSTARLTEETAAILSAYHTVATLIDQKHPERYAPALRDIREQLASLLPPEFLLQTPPAWRPHLPRFLKAIELRIRKLASWGVDRDAAMMREVRSLWQRHRDYTARHPARADRPDLTHFRWMIEELRVSLFAQELKTSQPASTQRLEKLWMEIRD